MAKSPDAFRTISEVADWLGVQAHVLRFWESKFSQVKPIKRAGGRRYYRPNDMLLLGGIRKLLHEDGLTIKGVQKILREEGISHVVSLSPPLDDMTEPEGAATPASLPEPEAEETGVVLSFEQVKDPEPEPDNDEERVTLEPEAPEEAPSAPRMDILENATVFDDPTVAEQADAALESETETAAPAEDTPAPAEPDPVTAKATPPEPALAPEPQSKEDELQAALPAFLRRPMQADAPSDPPSDNPPPPAEAAEPEPAAEPAPEPEPKVAAPPPAPKPRVLDLPPFKPEADYPAAASALSNAFRIRKLTAAQGKDIAPLLDRLTTHRDHMSSQRRNRANPAPND